MYTLEEMANLPDKEFYDAFVKGELNSMDLSAREYFERKDFIAEQVTKREILKQIAKGDTYVYNFTRGENATDEYMVPKYAIAVAEDETSPMSVTFVESEEERERIVETFQRTGILSYLSPTHNKHVERDVQALLVVDIQEIYVSKEFNKEFKIE